MGSTVTNVMGLVGADADAYNSVAAAREERRQAELAAREYEAQAALRDTEAEELLKLGGLNQIEQGMAARGRRATTRTGYAHAGVKVDSGSALDTVADDAAWSEYERQRLEYETNLKAWGLNQEAAALRNQAAATRAAGASAGRPSFSAGSVFSQASAVAGLFSE